MTEFKMATNFHPEGEPAATKGAKTGDHAGFPTFLKWVAALLIAAGIFGGIGIGSGDSELAGIMGWSAFVGCELTAITLLWFGEVLAALRGIRNRNP